MTHRECNAEAEGSICIPATGNGMKSHDNYDTYIHVSGGYGNRDIPSAEVHLRMNSNDGEFAQSWFPAEALVAAINAKALRGMAEEIDRLRAERDQEQQWRDEEREVHNLVTKGLHEKLAEAQLATFHRPRIPQVVVDAFAEDGAE